MIVNKIMLKNYKIPNGKMLSAERYTSSQVPGLDQVFEGLPPRTVVKAVLHPAVGSNINLEIWLPDKDKWNNRFLGLGNGGPAGKINPAIFIDGIKRGYAVVSTDMGTAPDPDSGIENEEVWKDFGFRATHLMTVVGKQIVEAYYGTLPTYSYFCGKSTGGQQALQEAQRYPDDYDGIVSGVPAHCRTPLHAYFLWNYQIFQECHFSEEQEKNIIAAAFEHMAEREVPQIAGRMISDPRCNSEDIDAVIALAAKKDRTLSEKHLAALRKLFDGPKHLTTNERIFNGIPLGSTFDIACGNLYLFNWVFGADKDLTAIDFGKDIDTYTRALGPYLNAENPDLSVFEKRGGKLIMYSGAADSCVPYHATLDYYDRVVDHFASYDKVKDFFSFYIIPGMSHGLGPGINDLPDFLDLIVNWREDGAAPGAIRGRQVIDGEVKIDIPLYPYPMKTSWDQASGFKAVQVATGGVERIASRFRPDSSS